MYGIDLSGIQPQSFAPGTYNYLDIGFIFVLYCMHGLLITRTEEVALLYLRFCVCILRVDPEPVFFLPYLSQFSLIKPKT